MLTLTEQTPLFVPPTYRFTDAALTYVIDPESPNWIAIEEHGAALLDLLDPSEPVTMSQLRSGEAAHEQRPGSEVRPR